MTIRRQTVLAIVPVFVLLALVGDGVAYFLETRALVNGLHQQAGALAVSIASFISPTDVARLKENRSSETSVPNALQRLDRWNIMLGLTIADARDGTVLLAYPADTQLPALSGTNAAALAARPYTVSSPPAETDTAIQRVIAHAPIRDADGSVAALVNVELDTSPHADEPFTMKRTLIRNALVIVSIGTAVAMLIASMMSREIKRLARAATRIDRGDYTPPPIGMIQEVAELGHTFGVLSGVVDEVRAKSQRALAENERFRTERDLLTVYRTTLPATEPRLLGTTRVSYAVTGAAADICFNFVSAGSKVPVIFFGRVAGSLTLETVLLTSAMRSELQDRVEQDEDPVSVLREIARLFPLHSATLLQLSTAPNTLRAWDVASDGRVTGPVEETLNGLRVCTDLPAAFVEAGRIYLQSYPTEAPPKMLEDLRRLAGDSSGSIVLLTPA